jgi:hypothetical protein
MTVYTDFPSSQAGVQQHSVISVQGNVENINSKEYSTFISDERLGQMVSASALIPQIRHTYSGCFPQYFQAVADTHFKLGQDLFHPHHLQFII